MAVGNPFEEALHDLYNLYRERSNRASKPSVNNFEIAGGLTSSSINKIFRGSRQRLSRSNINKLLQELHEYEYLTDDEHEYWLERLHVAANATQFISDLNHDLGKQIELLEARWKERLEDVIRDLYRKSPQAWTRAEIAAHHMSRATEIAHASFSQPLGWVGGAYRDRKAWHAIAAELEDVEHLLRRTRSEDEELGHSIDEAMRVLHAEVKDREAQFFELFLTQLSALLEHESALSSEIQELRSSTPADQGDQG